MITSRFINLFKYTIAYQVLVGLSKLMTPMLIINDVKVLNWRKNAIAKTSKNTLIRYNMYNFYKKSEREGGELGFSFIYTIKQFVFYIQKLRSYMIVELEHPRNK